MTTEIPESLKQLKAEARARLATAHQLQERKEAEESSRLVNELAAALRRDLPECLHPFTDLPASAHGSAADVTIRLPGHLPLAALFCRGHEGWTRDWWKADPVDLLIAPEPARSFWRVSFPARGRYEYFHELGAALAAAESDDPADYIEMTF